MTREEILDEAKRLITQDRQEQYGDAEQNYKVVGELWGAYILSNIKSRRFTIFDTEGEEVETLIITPAIVLTMLALMKLGREVSGNHKDDNFVDAAGYIALSGEITAKNKEVYHENN